MSELVCKVMGSSVVYIIEGTNYAQAITASLYILNPHPHHETFATAPLCQIKVFILFMQHIRPPLVLTTAGSQFVFPSYE